MNAVPQQPTHHVDPLAALGRDHRAALGEIDTDRVRFPQHEIAIDQRRRQAVGIDRGISVGLDLLDGHGVYLDRQIEMVDER